MNSIEIGRHRLTNQQIIGNEFKEPVEVVAWLGAVQAQEYALSKWSIGFRLADATDQMIEAAFNRGEILRTHLLRPTWHFVTQEDIRWMLTLTAPRVNGINAFMYRKMELDQPLFTRANNEIIKALRNGKQLTRSQLQTVLERKKIIASGVRLSCIMMQAELDGIICSGPRLANQFTYALLEEWVPPVKKLTAEEALAKLTSRYFNSRGPATLKDYVTWSGLTVAQARHGLELVNGDFIMEKSGEDTHYFPAGLLTVKPVKKAFLLPPYDEYIMGYKNRDDIFYARNKAKSKPATLFDNMIIYDGQVVGSWRRSIQARSVMLEYHLWDENKAVQAAVKSSINQFAVFVNLPVIKKKHGDN